MTALEPVKGVMAANTGWGANCGPVAIAAALGIGLDRVRAAVERGGRFRGWMGVRDLRSAVARAGARIVRERSGLPAVDVLWIAHALAEATAGWSDRMVVLLRFCGPWDGVPRVAATYRHAFAYSRENLFHPCFGVGSVCDVNNFATADRAPWIPARQWRNRALLDLGPDRWDGRVATDWIAQVSP
jgi:hypothetical protein